MWTNHERKRCMQLFFELIRYIVAIASEAIKNVRLHKGETKTTRKIYAK